MIRLVLFDFGGVIADEGFRDGLRAIGMRHGLDPDGTFEAAREAAFSGGYASGKATEAEFWREFRARTGIDESEAVLRREILDRFVPRPEVLALADRIMEMGFLTAILSDQTNWLDEIEARTAFSAHFGPVFNSYRIGKTKLDPTVFTDVCASLGVAPDETVLIDDSPGNVSRARSVGLHAILFVTLARCREELASLLGATLGP
jgi:putative hydrolase of the HAD superfamily